MTKVQFHVDADLKQAIVTGAIRRQLSLDFKSANNADLEGVTDHRVDRVFLQELKAQVMQLDVTDRLELLRAIAESAKPTKIYCG